jgi:hypothetical protein
MIPQAIAHYRIKAADDFNWLHLIVAESVGNGLSGPDGRLTASSGVCGANRFEPLAGI